MTVPESLINLSTTPEMDINAETAESYLQAPRTWVMPRALTIYSPPSVLTLDDDLKKMDRDRSESLESGVASLQCAGSIKDDTPLYYCDKDVSSKSLDSTRRAERALFVATGLTVCFIIAEVIGGYIANSLAIMTDAGHMLSDLTSFIISLIAIRMAQMQPTKRLSFGFHRAEVLGALASVLMIWILTAVLVYMAIVRMVHNNFDVDADVMLITAGVGVAFNIIMGLVLHMGKTGHSHFGQSHSHHNAEAGDHSHGGHEGGDHHKHKVNINVRAAFVHVLGDLVQSCGVFLAAAIIKFTQWRLADPVCTFVFSILVLVTTAAVFRDTILVLMEAVPRHIDLDALNRDLCSIEGVRDVHSLRAWSLTMDKSAVSVHLDTEKNCDSNHVVHEANERLKIRHGIHFITVQVQCVCRRSVSEQSLLSVTSPNAAQNPQPIENGAVQPSL